MPPALQPPTEASRLAALRSYEILDTACEEAFDGIVELAARLTGSPISLVSLVDSDRQWFKARHGIDATEMPRDQAICAHAILEPSEPLVIGNLTMDGRFSDNPIVTGMPNIRAYLGVPLTNLEGHSLGTLCVIDHVPRIFDEGLIDTIRTLARSVVVNLELRRALIQSREMALTDQLTGLANRRAVITSLAEFVARGDPVVVITVDLDHFKEANDAEGHSAGDELLRATAYRLKACVRRGDIVGRIGGDEFAVLLDGLDDQRIVADIAQRISAALHRPVPLGTKHLRLGATLGVAASPLDADEPELLMRTADEAMVRAKRDRRGGIGWASRGDATRLQRAAAIVRAFDDVALEGARIRGATVHFQPIVTLRSATTNVIRVLAIEALARWTHPDVGAVQPQELFSVIGPERTARLSAEVRMQALAVFAELRGDCPVGTRVAVNLSATEVARADIALEVASQVERAGLSLQALEVEITEEVLLDRVSDRTLDQLATLRGRGARLMLDDFGTGNSGLSQLLRLPLDGVKLDKRFVQRLGMDPRAEEIVRATVSLAHGLGLEVVAEGIETETQETVLRDLGCDAAQGYRIARPMTSSALTNWFQTFAAREFRDMPA